ncbi:DUF1761 domain-containing protein [Tumebacillus flagellatus]|uniref:DUF1761 domain-containing protein n=1 Tax=Tumebacillus flagellatus TaxID=1157490 RepID=A0A074LQ82_9BACL|nr:DUF1761 domain-containing protein [Tumebacillus flagellatus]KEO83259.1 hypothetical protein EL26_11250 [Tumebacillus flagellatus]
MSIDFSQLNVWAILVTIVISMVFGALWYSPVMFGNVWAKLVGLKPGQNPSAAGPMIGTVIMTIIATLALAVFIQLTGAATALQGFWVALLLCIILAAKIAVNYFFEGRGFKLYLLTIGFHTIPYLIGGILLAVWK